jgi:hypothetical protein
VFFEKLARERRCGRKDTHKHTERQQDKLLNLTKLDLARGASLKPTRTHAYDTYQSTPFSMLNSSILAHQSSGPLLKPLFEHMPG